jgi:hypothetical protein
MSLLNIPKFVGVNPRGQRSPGRYNFATIAHNMSVDDNAIYPLLSDALVSDDGESKRVYCGCTEHLVDPCTTTSSYVDGGCERHIISPLNEEPYFLPCDSDCGVAPVRTSPPVIESLSTGTGVWDREADMVSYAITYKTCLCDETAPSYATLPVVRDQAGNTVITGLPIPPSYVSEICIYRTQVGFRSGTEEVQEPVTEWYAVGSVTPGTTTFTDSLRGDALGEIMRTRKHHPMPEGLCQVQVVPGTRELVGYAGKTLWFSVDGEPTNWAYTDLTFDKPIAQIIPNAGFITVITVDGKHYTVVNGDCQKGSCKQVIERSTDHKHLPTGCCQSGIDTPFGNIVPTVDGLMLYKGDGSVEDISQRWFTKRDWRSLGSESAIVAYHEGKLFLTMGGTTYMNMLGSEHLTTVDMDAQWYQNTPTGELLYGNDTGLFHVFGGNVNRGWSYSQNITVPTPAVFTHITADACDSFKFAAHTGCTGTTDLVSDYAVKCLNTRLVANRRMTVTLSGTECVRSVTLGSSQYALGVS